MSLKRLFIILIIWSCNCIGVKSTEQSRPPDIGGGQKKGFRKNGVWTPTLEVSDMESASVVLTFELGLWLGYGVMQSRLSISRILQLYNNIHSKWNL